MITKGKIACIRLLHQKKHREEQGLFIVEGKKSCLELYHSNFEIIECYVTEIFDEIKDVNVILISEKEMERISCLATPQKVLCVVKTPNYSLEDIDNEKPLLILDTLRDPGNLGTIIRTADWFGFSQILCSETCVEFTNPKVIQATMGSFTRVKMIYSSLENYLETKKTRKIYGLFMEGDFIQNQKFTKNDIIVLGSESHGITPSVTKYINNKISIPLISQQASVPESLNAAIAAGIFLYQFCTPNPLKGA